jgi:hypothetical protein
VATKPTKAEKQSHQSFGNKPSRSDAIAFCFSRDFAAVDFFASNKLIAE